MKTLLLFLFAFSFLTINEIKAQRTCGSAENYQLMLDSDPSFKLNQEQIEQWTAEYVQHPEHHSRALKTIPVVVHVVYNTTTQNISDAQIQSQIDVLNKDFRKLNTDWTNTPAAFQPYVTDCEIEFCLAKQDPNGNSSTGIVRKSTSVTSFATNDAVKFDAQGGDNAWDATKYLNIWVCNLSGGVLGYAQFPGGSASTDGVVIRYNAFGTTGAASIPYNLGRTATHEVGHWLNLFHIWGDDGGSCAGSDQVNDTPNQGGEHYGCPTFPQLSCASGSDGDMYMNYMDYTNDACMYMFTAGQKARMDALFTSGGARASLLTSPGCTQVSTTACGTPGGLNVTNITVNSATVNWAPVVGVTYYNVQYKLSTSTTWISLTTTTTSMNLISLTAGSIYNTKIQAVCGSGSSNFSSTYSFLTNSSTACSNTYEPNNSMSTSQTIASNGIVTSMIGSAGDNDYYKVITTTAAPKLKVTLTNLPFDYDIKLYNVAGQLLRSSSLRGTSSEVMTFNNAAVGSVYYIYVYGYAGANSSTSCYKLTTLSSATNLKEESPLEEEIKPDINLYPNPVSTQLHTDYVSLENEMVQFSIYNAMGQKVYTQTVNSQEGFNHQAIDVNSLSNGMYVFEMIQHEERKIQKFVVQH